MNLNTTGNIGIQINPQEEYRRTLLGNALCENEKEKIQKYLYQFSIRDGWKRVALHWVTNVETAQFFVKLADHRNTIDQNGETPLHLMNDIHFIHGFLTRRDRQLVSVLITPQNCVLENVHGCTPLCNFVHTDCDLCHTKALLRSTKKWYSPQEIITPKVLTEACRFLSVSTLKLLYKVLQECPSTQHLELLGDWYVSKKSREKNQKKIFHVQKFALVCQLQIKKQAFRFVTRPQKIIFRF